MIYLLDTNMIVFVVRGMRVPAARPRRVLAEKIVVRIKAEIGAGNTVGISAVTRAELEYGAANAADPDKEQEALEKILFPFEQYDFDARRTPRFYGIIRHDLERKGQTIGGMDLLIAAHALALGAVLVTNNLREFSRIPHLKLENWT